VDVLKDSLTDIESSAQTAKQRGVRTVTGTDAITERVIEFIETAADEVVYMTLSDLLSDQITEALGHASDQGVSIRLAGLSESVESTIRGEIPEADSFESLWSWSETPASRLLMVDQTKTFVSVRVPEASGPREETAIRGTGETNSLVTVLRMLFTWQLDDGPSGR
jgi:hypothetical protein